ncbi:MAG: ROK family protein [Candidatus Parvarchaeota archaeon]|nr:ROK family protein [Candidatus Parvarchaeota archaeon]
MDKGLKVCADIGGTNMRVALMDKKLRILDEIYTSTPKVKDEFFDVFLNAIKKFSGKSDILNVAVAARLDKNGKVILSWNLPLLGVKLKKILSRYFKKVSIDNDAACAALMFMRKKDLRNALVIAWGTGIGGAFLVNGKLYRGNGIAGEIGHMQVFDGYGNDVEDLIGGKAMKRRYGRWGEELHNLAKRGNQEALEDFEEIGEKFGRYLASIIFMFDPKTIVMVGSFSYSWDFMKRSAMEELKRFGLNKRIKIYVVKDKTFVIKGAYLMDDYREK